MVEHGDLLGHAHRIVPGQHDDHRAELDRLGAAREVAQELQDVRAHGVVGEVMLHAPDQIEAERFGEIAEIQFCAVDFVVRPIGIGRLENDAHPDMHRNLPHYVVLESLAWLGGEDKGGGKPCFTRISSSPGPEVPRRSKNMKTNAP